ncbi:MAG: HAD family hydrolase [Chloroherpetonaceae bacterium]|nr:HAD family hydrolase [bacterium]
MKKAILFDFGGTLDTDGIHWSEKFYEVYQDFNINIPKEIMREVFVFAERKAAENVQINFTLKQTLRIKFKYQIEFLQNNSMLSKTDNINLDELTEYCYNDVLEKIKIAKNLLDDLSQDYLLGLVSNYYGNLDTILEELSLKKYFSSVIDSAVVKIRKPDPQIFQLILDKLGVSPTEAIVIGDDYDNDIIPSKYLGCYTIWLKGKGWSNPIEVKNADSIITTIKEIPDIINKII